MGDTQRRKLKIVVSTKQARCYVDLDSGKCFEDEKKQKEIAITKNLITLMVSIPRDIRFLEVRKAMFSPIGALATNRNIWPKPEAIALKLFLDNREIDMIDSKGEFRRNKYTDLCNALAWKKWALLLYTFEDGSTKAILWWNNRN